MKRVMMVMAVWCLCGCLAGADELTGVRSAGVGGAFTAYRDDVSVLFINPAGLAGLQYGEVGVMGGHCTEFGQVGTQLGVVRALKMPLWGRMWSSAMHMINEEIGSTNNVQAGFTLATEDTVLDFPLRWGGTGKYVTDLNQKLTSLALDAGVQTDLDMYHLSLGVAIRNIGSGSEDAAPFRPAAGAVWHTPYGRLSGDFNWVHSSMYFSQGFETDLYAGLLRGRIGILNGPSPYFTAGFGAYLWPYAVDTAFGWPMGADRTASYFQLMVRYRFDGADFSSIFLNSAIEKAMSIEGRRHMKNPGVIGGVATLEPPDLARELIERPAPRPQSVEPKHEKTITWPQYHAVQAGQTLRGLAQKYYGDPNKWQMIFNANTGKIERGQPRVGEELVIPAPK